ncbi:HemK family protein methyltransferase [Candidatus Peribacteria bacterium]|nr:HemK family protein methyltransferase [Candidatus Peribacteria bacterium]
MSSNQTMPEEYLDGYVIFMGRRFNVDPRALIPRLETEELVKYCLNLLQHNPTIQTVIDVGTGSGIVPISLYEHGVEAKMYATDKSPDALELARENAAVTCADDITFLQGDLLQPIVQYFATSSVPDEVLITANLPYVREKEIHDALVHEPRMAFLGGGQTGFELYERFFDQLLAWKNRPRTCHVVIEFGLWQRDIAETILMSKNCSYTFFADLRGIERFAHICLSA